MSVSNQCTRVFKPGDKVLVTLQGMYEGHTGVITGLSGYCTTREWIVVLDTGVDAAFDADQLLLQQPAKEQPAGSRYIVTAPRGVAYRHTRDFEDRVKRVQGPLGGETIDAIQVEGHWVKVANGLWLPIIRKDGGVLLESAPLPRLKSTPIVRAPTEHSIYFPRVQSVLESQGDDKITGTDTVIDENRSKIQTTPAESEPEPEVSITAPIASKLEPLDCKVSPAQPKKSKKTRKKKVKKPKGAPICTRKVRKKLKRTLANIRKRRIVTKFLRRQGTVTSTKPKWIR